MICAVDAEHEATVGALCPTHADDLRKLITRAPGLLDELETTITRQSAQVRGVIGGGDGGAAMPFHVGASITRSKLVGHLAGMVYAAGLSPSGLSAHEQADTAANGLPRIAAHPKIQDLYIDLSSTISEATRMVDIQGTGVVVGECDCRPAGTRQPQLVAEHTFGAVDCPACYARWNIAELIAERQDRVEEARNTRMPVTEATRYLKAMGYRVTYEALKKRCQRGVLNTEGGLRLRDAMDLLDSEGKGPRVAID